MVSGFVPSEEFWILDVMLDIAADCHFQFIDGALGF
jgi:hypothetical protein